MRPPEHRLSSLDLFRGIAIASVFLHHCLTAAFDPWELPWAGWILDFSPNSANLPALLLYPLSLGAVGVPLFFVISGFCIHLSANRRAAEGPRGFFIRRFFRIYPPYLLALLFFSLVWPWTRTSLHSDWGRAQIAAHALLVQNLCGGWFFGINPSFWSIAVEAQLYVLYPLLLLLVRRWTWRRIIVYLAMWEGIYHLNLGIYFALTGQDAPAWLEFNPFAFWFSWSLGALLAEAHLRNKSLPFADSSPWLWAGAVVVTNIVRPLTDLTFLFAAVLAANLIARQLMASENEADRPPRAPFFARPEGRLARHLRAAGLCSYSLYLVHQPILNALAGALSSRLAGIPASGWITFAACAALWFIILPLSAILFRWVERPAIVLGEKLLRRPPPRPDMMASDSGGH
jgi:peptidoglycan/LPS O-acetylase OafA/YrhL